MEGSWSGEWGGGRESGHCVKRLKGGINKDTLLLIKAKKKNNKNKKSKQPNHKTNKPNK